VSAPRAADLPVGSVVAMKSPGGVYDSSGKQWVKDFREHHYCWTDQHGHLYNDFMVQQYMDQRGAQVLRVGDGQEQP
jgi:hypothetical protein